MISLRGPKLKIIAGILAVIALAAGIYLTFFRSQGFVKTTGTIVALREDSTDDSTVYYPTVEYTVDGKTYSGELDTGSGSYKVGKTIPVLYDPSDPAVVHDGSGVGIYFLVVGAVILAVLVWSTVQKKRGLQQLEEQRAMNGGASLAPSLQGEERELYFLTDTGTAKVGHRIEDRQRRVLYEAKMTKFSLTSPYGFDFIDHEHNKTTAHLVGHEEETDWNSLILDNHYTLTFDGEDIWKHLKRNSIRVDSTLGGGSDKLIGTNYVIYHNDVEIARVETTSQYVHEEDAEEHKIAKAVPVKGFFRIWTRAKDLEVLFVTLVAFARTGATADNGGNRKTLFNTLKNS